MEIRVVDRRYIGIQHKAKVYKITVLLDETDEQTYTIKVVDSSPLKGKQAIPNNIWVAIKSWLLEYPDND